MRIELKTAKTIEFIFYRQPQVTKIFLDCSTTIKAVLIVVVARSAM